MICSVYYSLQTGLYFGRHDFPKNESMEILQTTFAGVENVDPDILEDACDNTVVLTHCKVPNSSTSYSQQSEQPLWVQNLVIISLFTSDSFYGIVLMFVHVYGDFGFLVAIKLVNNDN